MIVALRNAKMRQILSRILVMNQTHECYTPNNGFRKQAFQYFSQCLKFLDCYYTKIANYLISPYAFPSKRFSLIRQIL